MQDSKSEVSDIPQGAVHPVKATVGAGLTGGDGVTEIGPTVPPVGEDAVQSDEITFKLYAPPADDGP